MEGVEGTTVVELGGMIPHLPAMEEEVSTEAEEAFMVEVFTEVAFMEVEVEGVFTVEVLTEVGTGGFTVEKCKESLVLVVRLEAVGEAPAIAKGWY